MIIIYTKTDKKWVKFMTDIPDVLKVAKSGYKLLLENKKVRSSFAPRVA